MKIEAEDDKKILLSTMKKEEGIDQNADIRIKNENELKNEVKDEIKEESVVKTELKPLIIMKSDEGWLLVEAALHSEEQNG